MRDLSSCVGFKAQTEKKRTKYIYEVLMQIQSFFLNPSTIIH